MTVASCRIEKNKVVLACRIQKLFGRRVVNCNGLVREVMGGYSAQLSILLNVVGVLEAFAQKVRIYSVSTGQINEI